MSFRIPSPERHFSFRTQRSPSQYDHARRLPSRRQSTRTSNGTVSTTRSTVNSAASAATSITLPAAYSKKIVVVGDGGCGKTCLLISYSQGYFPEVRMLLAPSRNAARLGLTPQQKYVPTVFENYITHTIHPPTGKTVELALWDTAGQEEYDRLRPLSYPETDLLFVCFAIDCPNSLENVMDKWHPEVLHFCPTTPVILLGLKSDLRTKRACVDLLKTQGLTPVTPEQGAAVAKQMSATYMECSSKEMSGVDEIFDLAVTMAVGDEKRAWNGTPDGINGSRKRKRACNFL
ncbi:MAG: Rho GTPase [Phylliscum demangeonii]|nr:MAG: Rho GTPase [Phylliscum demangeonii]